MSDAKKIIMNFTRPPSLNDIEEMAADFLEAMPDDLLEHCEDLVIQIEDFPDELAEQELELEDPYELLALYKSGDEIAPGVQKKSSNQDDVLILYRRPILDMWAETGDNLSILLRQIIMEEVARQHDFSEDQIDDMVQNHNSEFV